MIYDASRKKLRRKYDEEHKTSPERPQDAGNKIY